MRRICRWLIRLAFSIIGSVNAKGPEADPADQSEGESAAIQWRCLYGTKSRSDRRTRFSPKVISEELGHARVAFTLDVYSHVLPHMQEVAAEKAQALLMKASVA